MNIMIEVNEQKYIKQGNNYYSKIKKILSNNQNDLQFMNRYLNRRFTFIPCGSCIQCSRVQKQFKRAYQTLNQYQKAYYYYSFARLAYNIIFTVPQSPIHFPYKKQRIKISVLNNINWRWIIKDIQIDYQQRKLNLIQQQYSINLRNYVLRQSKNKDRKAMVLQSLSSIQYLQTFRFSNHQGTYQSLYSKFKSLIQLSLRARISRTLGIKLLIIDQKNIDGRFSIEDHYQQKLAHYIQRQQIHKASPLKVRRKSSTFLFIKSKIDHDDYFQKFEQIDGNIFYNYEQNIMRKQYRFNFRSFEQIPLMLMMQYLTDYKYFKNWKKSLRQIRLLNERQDSRDYHEIYVIDNKDIHFTYNRVKYDQNRLIYIFDSQIDVDDCRADIQIDYCITKLQIVDYSLKVTQQCRILYDRIDKQYIKQINNIFLGDINQIILSNYNNYSQICQFIFSSSALSSISNQISSQSFYTITASQGSYNQQHQFINNKQSYLEVRHATNPQPKNKLQSYQIKRNQDNQIKIKQLKLINNLKTQTWLTKICNSYAYAPLFLEAAAKEQNSVDKFKYIAVFSLVSHISQSKFQVPLASQLGETYQAFIDGCPVYGQQISCFPPISATLMIGRGYILYAQLQTNLIVDGNIRSQYTSGKVNIVFDDGSSIIRYNNFSRKIKTLKNVNAQVQLIGKSYFLDIKNRIYLKLEPIIHKTNNSDQIIGKIVKLRSQIKLQNSQHFQIDDILQQYEQIKGNWKSKIFYGEKCIFNCDKHFSYEVIPYISSLQSDSVKNQAIKQGLRQKSRKYVQQEVKEIKLNDKKTKAKFYIKQ